MFLFLENTTLAVEGTCYIGTVSALMWVMVMEKDMQQIILSVTSGNTMERTKLHGHFFARRLRKNCFDPQKTNSLGQNLEKRYANIRKKTQPDITMS